MYLQQSQRSSTKLGDTKHARAGITGFLAKYYSNKINRSGGFIVLKDFQAVLPNMLVTLKTLVELESPSTDKPLCDNLIDWLAEEVRHRGGTPSVIEHPQRGNHLRAEWGDGAEQLLVLCHVDTVWGAGEIQKRPFRIEGNRAYGPGVFDMKCGAVQALYAIDYLRKHGWPLNKKVVVLFNTDEETGSITSRDLIEEEAKRSKAVLVLEPAIAPQGALKTARKGVGRFDLVVEGVAAHSGSAPEQGASANLEMARQTVWLHSLNDFEKGTTVNVGFMQGGTRANVVAARAQAQIDLRVVTLAEAERVVPLILSRQADTPNTKVTITGGLNRPPMERTNAIASMYALAEKLAAELGIEICEGATGGGSDGNFTAALGIPTIDGLGAVGEGAHAVHEHVVISKIPERTALLARLIQELGK